MLQAVLLGDQAEAALTEGGGFGVEFDGVQLVKGRPALARGFENAVQKVAGSRHRVENTLRIVFDCELSKYPADLGSGEELP